VALSAALLIAAVGVDLDAFARFRELVDLRFGDALALVLVLV
jgi:hypothetical protein